jgi:hypothetical protein
VGLGVVDRKIDMRRMEAQREANIAASSVVAAAVVPKRTSTLVKVR